MRRALAVEALLAVPAALGVLPPAGAEPAQSRIVDRVYRCPVGVSGGIRSVNVYAQSGVRDFDDPTKWKTPAHVDVSTAVGEAGTRVRARGVVSEPWTRTWAITFSVYGCSGVSARVPLATRGLAGGRASQFIDRYQCPAPRNVLVRVRLELSQRGSVGRTSRAPVRTGAVAVRAETGRPIAYADVHESGRARIFVSRTCVAE